MGMLVLSRRNGESFYITKDIQVRILDVVGNQVRLGVEAPKDMAVYREELREKFEIGEAVVEVIGETSVAA